MYIEELTQEIYKLEVEPFRADFSRAESTPGPYFRLNKTSDCYKACISSLKNYIEILDCQKQHFTAEMSYVRELQNYEQRLDLFQTAVTTLGSFGKIIYSTVALFTFICLTSIYEDITK